MTIHEKLMSLPVFKGIGMDALLSILEKMHLEFQSHAPEELLVSRGESCDGLLCLMSGEVEVCHTLAHGSYRLKCRYGAGKVFGLDRLFGMEREYGVSVKAIRPCGTMAITKQQYMQIVSLNDICFINLLNYLSYKSQRVDITIESLTPHTIVEKLALLMSLLSDRDCIGAVLEFDLMESAPWMEDPEMREELRRLQNLGLVRLDERGYIEILSRAELLELAERK